MFKDAVDPFVARLPNQSKWRRQRYTGGPEYNKTREVAKKPPAANVPPVSGCYRCTATDHYANDPKYHPVLPDGTQGKVSKEMKKAILERVEKSELSEAVKAAEKDRVRQYWSQRGL